MEFVALHGGSLWGSLTASAEEDIGWDCYVEVMTWCELETIGHCGQFGTGDRGR